MHHVAAASRTRLAGVLLACAALLAAGLQVATVAPASAATVAAHPYSDPVWFPLRTDVEVGCVGNSTGANNSASAAGRCDSDHVDYWGLNLDSPGGVDDNPAVYAAGAGTVLAVTADQPACGGTNHNGNLVEIDHGGGVVSVYEHLATITVTRGEQVYPSTELGTMGASGAPCRSPGVPANAYLDFQVRNYGGTYLRTKTGLVTTTDVKGLRGCTGSASTSTVWPAGLGLGGSPSAWTDVDYLTPIATAGQGDCYPGSAAATPARPAAPRAAAGNGRAALSWTAVRGADRYMVQTEIYRKGSGWDAPCTPNLVRGCTVGYTAVTGAARATTIRGLSNGRRYRVRLSVHNKAGWSLPGRWVLVTPQAVPDAPTFHRLTGGRGAVALSWQMPKNDLNGATLRGFQVGIDYLRNGRYTRFVFDTIGDTNHHLWTGLRRHTTYRVLVRAVTTTGVGYWMHAHRTRTS